MRILATDLDRTLLPNGRWPADAGAIELFNELTRASDVLLVYVTGRNLALTEAAIRDYGVRYPDVLCGDVGSTIRRHEDGRWRDDPGWARHVRAASPRWDANRVREAVASIAGLREQEAEHCNPFKQSYYADHGRREAILRAVDGAVRGRFDEAIVYSYDSESGAGLLDFLPASATKRTSLTYVASVAGVTPEEVVFCGDSGNDSEALTAGFRGVLVRNADEQLVAEVRSAMARDPTLEVYFATGGFRGLNGYYASGVLEGAQHYGLLAEDAGRGG